MACGGRRWLAGLLLTTFLLTVFVACKREDPKIRALTEKAAQADDAAQQLRQAWSDQFRRLRLAKLKEVSADSGPMLLTADQRKALEARVRIEKDSSRRALLQEILDRGTELETLRDRLMALQAALPEPEIARPGDSHYGMALRFLKGRGHSEEAARKLLSRVHISERMAPGFEVYHFYANGDYGTWVAQGRAPISPRDFALQDPEALVEARDAAVAVGQRLQRELGLLERQKRLIEQEIAAIQSERTWFLEGRAQLQSENAQQLARLNSLHYLIGVRDTLEKEGVIEIPLLGKDQSGPRWRDALFTHHLDLRSGATLVIQAQDLGLRQIGKVSLVPGSYRPGEHYRLTLSADRQTATVDLLTLPRFKNDKVVFAVAE